MTEYEPKPITFREMAKMLWPVWLGSSVFMGLFFYLVALLTN